MGNAWATQARAVHEAAVQGALAAELVQQLADSILDAEPVRLALTIREGGPHVARRAIELAALVLASGTASADTSGSRSSS